MKKPDEEIVAEFLAIEYEMRLSGAQTKYALAAKQAVDAFEGVRDELDRLRRQKAVEEFDDVWPGCA